MSTLFSKKKKVKRTLASSKLKTHGLKCRKALAIGNSKKCKSKWGQLLITNNTKQSITKQRAAE